MHVSQNIVCYDFVEFVAFFSIDICRPLFVDTHRMSPFFASVLRRYINFLLLSSQLASFYTHKYSTFDALSVSVFLRQAQPSITAD